MTTTAPYPVDHDIALHVRGLLGAPLFNLIGAAYASYANAEQRQESSLALTRQVMQTWETWESAGRSVDDFTAAVHAHLGDLDQAPPKEGWVTALRDALTALDPSKTDTASPASTTRRRSPEELAARDAERSARLAAGRTANPYAGQPVALEDFTWVGSRIMRRWYLDPSKSDEWRRRVLDAVRPLLAAGWTLEGLREALDKIEVEEPPANPAAPVGWLGDVALPRLRDCHPNTLRRKNPPAWEAEDN